MDLTPLEHGLVFLILFLMVVLMAWVARRGAKRTHLAERAELRMEAGELAGLVVREFSHKPCTECGGVAMELIAIGDSGGSADFRCTECGTEGSASVSGEASEQTWKTWEKYSALRSAFEKGNKLGDPEDVAVRFRVWVAK